MKVIDLLNKIANGEEVPKKIKIKDEIWIYDEIDYRASDDRGYLFEVHTRTNCQDLNEEIEIPEEPKEIPEKLDHLIGYDIRQFDDLKEYVEITTNDLFGEVNRIIDTLNQVLDYLESKGE